MNVFCTTKGTKQTVSSKISMMSHIVNSNINPFPPSFLLTLPSCSSCRRTACASCLGSRWGPPAARAAGHTPPQLPPLRWNLLAAGQLQHRNGRRDTWRRGGMEGAGGWERGWGGWWESVGKFYRTEGRREEGLITVEGLGWWSFWF